MTRKSNVAKSTLDMKRVAAVGEKLRRLKDELTVIFPERRHLIEQIIYAMLTQEHVLVFGTFGTGKTDLIHTLFSCITAARIFPIGLSKFMTEAHIIGIPDPKVMREKGDILYRRDGGILDADFAELDELFDSNPPLLRVLLGILNERQFKRGRQVEDAKLHTAIACTNGDPAEEMRKHPELGAVIDRFLFLSRVRYLQGADSRRLMYTKYLEGSKPTVSIPLEDLKYASSIVVDANQITDPLIIDTYDRVIDGYQKQVQDQVISDRRRCKLFQLIEANALLFGRFDVDLEDIMAIRWGLCIGNDERQHDAFKAVAEPVIAEGKKRQQQSIDELQVRLLNELAAKIPTVPQQGQCTSDELVKLSRALTALRGEVEKVKPQLPSTQDKKHQIISAIEASSGQILQMITNG